MDATGRMNMKQEIRQKIYNKYGGHCAYCGEEIEYKKMQVDHIFPQSKKHWLSSDYMKKYEKISIDNIDEIDNLNPSCRSCNLWKHNLRLEGFRRELQRQVDRVNRYSANYRMAKKYGLIIETGKPVSFYFEKLKTKDKHEKK